MRRVLLTLFVAVALAVGGVASAGAAFACPQQQSVHACCPDGEPSDNQTPQGQRDMTCCLIGSVCRIAVAATPQQDNAPAPANAIEAEPALPQAANAPQRLLQEYWRPPRTHSL